MTRTDKGLILMLAGIVTFQLVRTLWQAYGVYSGSTTLDMFSETFAVFVMLFTMALMALAFIASGQGER